LGKPLDQAGVCRSGPVGGSPVIRVDAASGDLAARQIPRLTIAGATPSPATSRTLRNTSSGRASGRSRRTVHRPPAERGDPAAVLGDQGSLGRPRSIGALAHWQIASLSYKALPTQNSYQRGPQVQASFTPDSCPSVVVRATGPTLRSSSAEAGCEYAATRNQHACFRHCSWEPLFNVSGASQANSG
jgi:hypothetical protein